MSESPKERVDRELIELLNGLRVALPGVPVLFAFLLTVPFAQGFGRTSDFQRLIYVVCLLCAAAATGFYIAPAAQHRVLFRSHDKERLLRRANLYAVIANAVLIGAVASAVLLVRLLSIWNEAIVAITGAFSETLSHLGSDHQGGRPSGVNPEGLPASNRNAVRGGVGCQRLGMSTVSIR